MPNRLQPLPQMTFVGGLNLRASQFELADNESPDLLNVDIDPRGGFYTRHGWQRWNQLGVVNEEISFDGWEPRNAHFHTRSDSTSMVYAAEGTKLYWGDETGLFSLVPTVVG